MMCENTLQLWLYSLIAILLVSCDGCPPRDICPDGRDKLVEKADCCPGEVPMDSVKLKEVIVDPNVLKADSIGARIIEHINFTQCPCDGSLGIVDTTGFSAEEKEAVAQSKTGGEGNPLFIIPEKETYDSDFYELFPDDVLPNIGNLNANPIKVAILDTGLDKKNERIFEGHIGEKLKVYPPISEDITDVSGHGSVVFSIIASENIGKFQYFIYKCTNDAGESNGFVISCALKCALRNNVDIINISLGSYINDKYLSDIMDSEGNFPAVITSQGNDCLLNDELPHYPSDYEKAYGIMAVYDDANDPMGSGRALWPCTNGFKMNTINNIAAPGMICTSLSKVRFGTSFATAYASRKFAMFLDEHTISGSRRIAFKDQFLNNAIGENTESGERYLYAAENCVDVIVIK